MTDSRSLPRFDLDAEAAVLSAALLSTDVALELAELIEPADFYADANRTVCQAIRDLAAKGEPVDIVAVASSLQARKQLERVGGQPYLAQLADATPAISHLEKHAAIVRGWARVRRALEVWRTLAAEASAGELVDVDEWLESCEQRAYAATVARRDIAAGPSAYSDLVPEAFEQIRNSDGVALGRPTGFRAFDAHTKGLRPGELWFVAGRPGHGKTAWAQQLAEQIGFDDPRAGTAFISMEMSRQQLVFRALARRAELPADDIMTRKLDRDGWHRVAAAAGDLVKLPIAIDEADHLTPLALRRKVRRRATELRNAKGADLALVVVDYVQLMSGDDVAKGTTRAVELGQISRSLKNLARELACTVVVLSQLARKPRGGGSRRPELDELRDSGALEADADLVVALHRPDEYRKPGEQLTGICEVLILKGRNCGTGAHELAFDGASSRFSNLEQQQEYAWA